MYPTCSNRVAGRSRGETLFHPPLTIYEGDTDVLGLGLLANFGGKYLKLPRYASRNIFASVVSLASAGSTLRILDWGDMMTYSPHSGHEPDQGTLLTLKPITNGLLRYRFGLTLAQTRSYLWS